MKRIGIIILGIGFGILCYIVFSLFFQQKNLTSPIDEVDTNKVIQQNSK